MSLLTRLLRVDLAEATFERRGFAGDNTKCQDHLEAIGRCFLTSYNLALSLQPRDSASLLDEVDDAYRGFAFEGAALAYAAIDCLSPWRSRRWQAFTCESGNRHIYTCYVGAGWVADKVGPIVKRLDANLDPLLGSLIYDGFGFSRGYFRHERVVLPWWLGPQEKEAFEQGVGRSLWFSSCASPQRIARRISDFKPNCRRNLWSGVGLACAYAGGISEEGIRELRKYGSGFEEVIAQGAAFAAEARARANIMTDFCESACRILCEMTASDAALVTQDSRKGLDGTKTGSYAAWRSRIQMRFAANFGSEVCKEPILC